MMMTMMMLWYLKYDFNSLSSTPDCRKLTRAALLLGCYVQVVDPADVSIKNRVFSSLH